MVEPRPLPTIFSPYLNDAVPSVPPRALYAWLSADDVELEDEPRGEDSEMRSLALEAVAAAWIDQTRNVLTLVDILRAPVSMLRIHDGTSRTIVADALPVDTAARGVWLLFNVEPNGPIRADYIGNIDQRAPIKLRLSKPEWVGQHALDRLADMDVLRERKDVSDNRLNRRLSFCDEPLGLAVYDIGQGSCAALVDESCRPMVYFDVGGGVDYPAPLRFCVARQPPVILSHWDQDHWYSLRKDTRLLRLTWIAPRQPLKTVQAAAAAHILYYGRLYVWGARRPAFTSRLFDVSRATGKTMNDSGLAVVAHLSRGDVLLPGDADYRFLTAPPALGALVATHHGANFAKSSTIPGPTGATSPIIFSYGQHNAYHHPRTVTRHRAAGWTAASETAKDRTTSRLGHCIIGAPGVRRDTGCAPGTCHLGDLKRV